MSIEGALKIFKMIIFCIFVVHSYKKAHFPKGVGLKSFQYEMRAIFTEKSWTRDFIQHSSLWEQ